MTAGPPVLKLGRGSFWVYEENVELDDDALERVVEAEFVGVVFGVLVGVVVGEVVGEVVGVVDGADGVWEGTCFGGVVDVVGGGGGVEDGVREGVVDVFVEVVGTALEVGESSGKVGIGPTGYTATDCEHG